MSTITALRPHVPDAAICDWLQLQETFGLACFDSHALQDIWHLTQPQACRRLRTMEAHGLITRVRRVAHGKAFWAVRAA
jgi:hypothetical protein